MRPIREWLNGNPSNNAGAADDEWEAGTGEGDPGDEGNDPAPDEDEALLAELDDDQRALVERMAAKREQAALGRVTEAAAKRGMAFTGSDFAVGNMQEFAEQFGIGRSPQQAQQPPQGQAPQAQGAQPQAPIVDPMPNMFDTDDWMAWHQRQLAAVAEATVKALQPQIAQIQTQFQARDQVGDAIARAKALLPDYQMEHISEHPEFDRYYREALLGTDPASWQEPQNVLGYAAYVAPLLKERGGFKPRKPAGDAPRDEGGRFQGNQGNRGNRQEQQDFLQRFGASPRGQQSGGRRSAEMDEMERHVSARFGITDPETLIAAADETGNALRELNRRKAEAAKKR